MATHNQTGNKGELLAADYFIKNGYKIIYQNWRHKHWEIDIIASKNSMLHFIEVKTRTSLKFGHPEEAVDKKKIRFLINASEEFLYQYPKWQRIQFDILSINIKDENIVDYFLIEDIYL